MTGDPLSANDPFSVKGAAPLSRFAPGGLLGRSGEQGWLTSSHRLLRIVAIYVVSILTAVLLTICLVVVVGGSPWTVADALYRGSLASGSAFSNTLGEAMPVLLVAVGTLITVRAGYLNIGQEGQLSVGAVAGAAIALNWHGPGPLVIVVTLVASALGGAALAALCALMKHWRNVNVILSTLLISYVADQLFSYVLSTPAALQQPVPAGQVAQEQSDFLSAAVRLPMIGTKNGFDMSSGVIIAVAVAALAAFVLARSRWGFRVRIIGLNPKTAQAFGISGGVAAVALIVSGALAGLAGGTMLTGTIFRLQSGFSGNLATDGLLAALVANDQPWALLPISLAFGMIETGGTYLVSTGIPPYIAQVLESLLVFAAIIPPMYLRRPAWVSAVLPKVQALEAAPVLETVGQP